MLGKLVCLEALEQFVDVTLVRIGGALRRDATPLPWSWC
jgi:hypothetical protein